MSRLRPASEGEGSRRGGLDGRSPNPGPALACGLAAAVSGSINGGWAVRHVRRIAEGGREHHRVYRVRSEGRSAAMVQRLVNAGGKILLRRREERNMSVPLCLRFWSPWARCKFVGPGVEPGIAAPQAVGHASRRAFTKGAFSSERFGGQTDPSGSRFG
jgi:hypothetical protein